MRTNTIGEVLNRLRDEFDDVTISRIRHLEAEGLITPDRTESGYRRFTDEDLERLRHIFRAQRDRGLELAEIRDELGQVEETRARRSAPPVDDASPPETLDIPDVHLTPGEIADASGLTASDVAQLREHGILGDGPAFDGIDLRIAQIAAQMLSAGLEVRHLRMYRQSADREAALLEQLVGALLRQRNPDSRRRAEASSRDLATLGAQLRRVMLEGEIRRIVRGPH